MSELDFDTWGDYTPVSDNFEQKNQRDLVRDNSNIYVLLKTDSVNLIELNNSDWLDMFDGYSEEDYDGVEFIRFKKDQSEGNLSIFSIPNGDLFLVKNNDLLYVIYVYQSNGYYIDDDKITFLGWDYNIILDVKTMNSKTIYIR
jgi:hypothetical protein